VSGNAGQRAVHHRFGNVVFALEIGEDIALQIVDQRGIHLRQVGLERAVIEATALPGTEPLPPPRKLVLQFGPP
jgi:hypothetical protein